LRWFQLSRPVSRKGGRFYYEKAFNESALSHFDPTFVFELSFLRLSARHAKDAFPLGLSARRLFISALWRLAIEQRLSDGLSVDLNVHQLSFIY